MINRTGATANASGAGALRARERRERGIGVDHGQNGISNRVRFVVGHAQVPVGREVGEGGVSTEID